MNALEAASLVMIPSGYENGTLGSLKPTDGTGDFTFSRGSDISATRVNEQGYIEKGYENLLLQSNTFSDAAWTKAGLQPPTSGEIGYDGSNDAWIADFTSTASRLETNVSLSGLYTFSVYAKAGTAAGIRMRVDGSSVYQSHFLLSGDGSVNVNGGITNNITKIGDNGWYRCSITINDSAINEVRIHASTGFTNGVGTLYIQDAMLNQGLVAYPYVETTTAPVAGGILEDMPRLDYTDSSCPSLKLEPQRTNLAPYSEYIEGLGLTDLTPTPNATISPEGLQNAYKVLTGTTGSEQISYQATNTSGYTKTQSVYIKPDSGVQWIRLNQVRAGFLNSASCWFDIQNGVKGSKQESGTTSVVDDATKIEDAGNGWYRLTLVCTDSTNNANFDTRVRTAIADGSGTRVSNGSYFVWGLQLEQDATYPTSYIPTYGTSQTRLKDICEASNVASLIGQTEGTLFIDYVHKLVDGTYNVFGVDSGNNTSRIWLLNSTSPAIRYSVDGVSLSSAASGFQYIEGQKYKVAIVYNTTYIKVYINGSLIIDDSGFTAPAIQTNFKDVSFAGTNNSFTFDNPVNQALYFPTALSDDECIELTTI